MWARETRAAVGPLERDLLPRPRRAINRTTLCCLYGTSPLGTYNCRVDLCDHPITAVCCSAGCSPLDERMDGDNNQTRSPVWCSRAGQTRACCSHYHSSRVTLPTAPTSIRRACQSQTIKGRAPQKRQASGPQSTEHPSATPSQTGGNSWGVGEQSTVCCPTGLGHPCQSPAKLLVVLLPVSQYLMSLGLPFLGL